MSEYQSYIPGIGLSLAVSTTTGDAEKLIRIEHAGTSANDTINGTFGVDLMRGLAGDDRLNGMGGDDKLFGGQGWDILTGGLGRDIMTGGAGHDTFVFETLTDSGKNTATRDVITDFTHLGDRIDLSLIDAISGVAGNQAFHFVGTAAFSHTAGELHYTKLDFAGTADDKTVVAGDVNGDGLADFQIELSQLITLTKADFVL